jgi:hypothetical protein
MSNLSRRYTPVVGSIVPLSQLPPPTIWQSPGQDVVVSPVQPIVPGTGECPVCKARREAEAAKKARQRDRRRADGLR